MFVYLTSVSSGYGEEVMVKIRKMTAILDAIFDAKQRPFWILGTCKSQNVVIMF